MKIKIIYLYLFLIIIYDILRKIFEVRGIYYICILPFIPSMLLFLQQGKKIVFQFTSLIWLLLIIYAFVNWKLSGLSNADNEIVFYMSKFFFPIGTMWVVYYLGLKYHDKTLRFILYCLAAYVLMGVLLQEGGSGSGGGWDARGGLTLGNELPLKAVCLAFFACLCNVTKCINKRIMLGLLILATIAILFVATRKALVALGLIVVFYISTYINLTKTDSVIKFILSVIVIIASGYYILHYTNVGLRFSYVEEQSSIVMMQYDVPSAIKFLGDRAIQYVLAWDLFIEQPITGVGLDNFKILTGYPVVLHSEYMVHLCENGIVGFILFCIFVISMFYYALKTYKNGKKNISLICIGGLLALCFVNLTAWTYDSPYFFAMYGMILAHCCPIKKYMAMS